jgi:hypothetical protein
MPLDRRGGGGYNTDLAEESPSELLRLDDDLIRVSAERAGGSHRRDGMVLREVAVLPEHGVDIPRPPVRPPPD